MHLLGLGFFHFRFLSSKVSLTVTCHCCAVRFNGCICIQLRSPDSACELINASVILSKPCALLHAPQAEIAGKTEQDLSICQVVALWDKRMVWQVTFLAEKGKGELYCWNSPSSSGSEDLISSWKLQLQGTIHRKLAQHWETGNYIHTTKRFPFISWHLHMQLPGEDLPYFGDKPLKLWEHNSVKTVVTGCLTIYTSYRKTVSDLQNPYKTSAVSCVLAIHLPWETRG